MTPFRVHLRQRSHLETALYAVIVGVLAALLLYRLLELSAAAEKSAMEATVAQLQSALYARAAKAVLEHKPLRTWQDRNPVALAHAVPPNYLGEFDHPDLASLEPGNWLYDRGRHELVYLVRRARGFSGGSDPVPAIRFRLRLERNASGAYLPALLHPVSRYEWDPAPG